MPRHNQQRSISHAKRLVADSEGKAEAAAEGAKGNAVIQRKRDHRKADAIALYDDGKGLDVNQIAKKLKMQPADG